MRASMSCECGPCPAPHKLRRRSRPRRPTRRRGTPPAPFSPWRPRGYRRIERARIRFRHAPGTSAVPSDRASCAPLRALAYPIRVIRDSSVGIVARRPSSATKLGPLLDPAARPRRINRRRRVQILNQLCNSAVNRRAVTIVAVIAGAGLCAVAYAARSGRSATSEDPPVQTAAAPAGDLAGPTPAKDSRAKGRVGITVSPHLRHTPRPRRAGPGRDGLDSGRHLRDG